MDGGIPSTNTSSVSAALAEALEAYEALATLGEEVEEEWGYVTDLSAAWRDRLTAQGAMTPSGSLDPAGSAAIEAAIAEIGRITDPHRAIDWLSTFPQIVLAILGAER